MFERLNADSETFLSRGYLLEGQTPQGRIKEIADNAERILGIKGFADKFYEYMGRGFYSLSTPVRTNFGTSRGLPISCYSIEYPDSVSGIMKTNGELGVMSKLGGGVGTYFGNLRGRGSPIKDNGESTGAVHFMELTDKVCSVIAQGNQRRGFTTPYLPISHPDIEEFLDIGTEGHPIQRCTTAVTIENDWMEEMIEGDKDKRKIRAKLLKRRSEVGYPYITYIGNANEQRVDVYKEKGLEIKTSNICVTGDTKILTDGGYVEISQLEDEYVNIWNGFEFSNVVVRKTGENQELVKVKTNSGYELVCTPYHKFYTQNGYGNYKTNIRLKRACELEPGDKIIKCNLPIIEGDKELDYAYDNGFYSGDGCLTKQGQRVYLYGEKRRIKEKITSITKRYYNEELDREYGHTNYLMDKFFVPNSEYTIPSRITWLSGLLDADGYVATNATGAQTIQLVSTNMEFLKNLQLMLQTLGCDSKIRNHSGGGSRLMPKNDGTGECGEYNTQDAHRILINGNSLYKLISLGLVCNRLNREIKEPSRLCSEFVKIESVEELEYKEDVYCFTEPKRGMGMFNGILTGNCQEIFLNTDEKHSFVCCLSSLNLEMWDEIIETDAIETMVFFLDSVMQEFIDKLEIYRESQDIDDKTTFMYMEKAYNFALRERALGMGVLGWHYYMQSKLIPIESEECEKINEDIFKTIKERAYKASEDLASKYGEPELMKGFGRRNSHLIAIAPTTSSAFILGQTSQSIEPMFSNYYTKNLAKHTTTIKNKFLEQVLKEAKMNTREVWDSIRDYDGSVQHLDFLTLEQKDVFKTFREIDQNTIIKLAADRQKYIDQGQSLNTIITPSMTSKDISNLCIDAWKQGIKGLYYSHSVNAAQETKRDIVQRKISCVGCEA